MVLLLISLWVLHPSTAKAAPTSETEAAVGFYVFTVGADSVAVPVSDYNRAKLRNTDLYKYLLQGQANPVLTAYKVDDKIARVADYNRIFLRNASKLLRTYTALPATPQETTDTTLRLVSFATVGGQPSPVLWPYKVDSLIKQGQAYSNADSVYTPQSWDALQKAIAEASAASAKVNASPATVKQAEIDAARLNLSAAIDGLKQGAANEEVTLGGMQKYASDINAIGEIENPAASWYIVFDRKVIEKYFGVSAPASLNVRLTDSRSITLDFDESDGTYSNYDVQNTTRDQLDRAIVTAK